MSLQVFAAYVGACFLLALTPGPAMSLMIAITTARGVAAGAWTLAGNTLGLALLVGAAALGMTSLMVFMSDWFDVIRWIGALYLIWLGVKALRRAWTMAADMPATVPPGRSRNWFLQGLFVALSNPKVLLFLGAFLPQFVNPDGDVAMQLLILCVVFVAVLALADALTMLLVARMRRLFVAKNLRLLDGLAGGVLLLGGLVLAVARRP